jgi:hypothetical protein
LQPTKGYWGGSEMPPTIVTMKKWGWTDEKINRILKEERLQELQIEQYLKTHPNAKMLDILEML